MGKSKRNRIIISIGCFALLYLFTSTLAMADEWFKIGVSFSNSGNHKEAIEAFNKSIEFNPRNVEAYNNRATAYGNLGNYQQAIYPCINNAT